MFLFACFRRCCSFAEEKKAPTQVPEDSLFFFLVRFKSFFCFLELIPFDCVVSFIDSNWYLLVSERLWWGLVCWTMLSRACTMLRKGGSAKSWLGHPPKSLSNFFWWCKSTVSLSNRSFYFSLHNLVCVLNYCCVGWFVV